MDRKHPKRKKDKLNPYTLKINDQHEYSLSFVDGEGVSHTLTIDEELYDLFNSFELEDISYMNRVSRHYEHSVLSDQEINSRSFQERISLEDEIIKNSEYTELHKAINELPEIQRRRIFLYYYNNLTYEQIAKRENCSKRAIKFSIDIAIRKIKSKLL